MNGIRKVEDFNLVIIWLLKVKVQPDFVFSGGAVKTCTLVCIYRSKYAFAQTITVGANIYPVADDSRDKYLGN